MSVMMSRLLCKHGPLCAGTRAEVEGERDRYISQGIDPKISELRIEDFDYQTHHVNSLTGEIELREKPLQIYSANDLYAQTPIKITRDLYGLGRRNMIPELCGIGISHEIENDPKIETRILFEKSERYGEEFYSLYTVWFEGNPVMICQIAVERTARYITDYDNYKKMVAYLFSLIPMESESDIISATEPMIELTIVGYDNVQF